MKGVWSQVFGRLGGRAPSGGSGQVGDAVRMGREDRLRRQERGAAWRAAGDVTPPRIKAEYEAHRGALDPELRAWCRPIAAWTVHDGDPSVAGSYMGGRPALNPGEPWPYGGEEPMRFWAQVNLAHLAPYAAAYGVTMPSDGLVQLFAADVGGELARYIPAADIGTLELRDEIPISDEWHADDDAEVQRIVRRSKLIELYPEALVAWQETEAISQEAVLAWHENPSPNVPGGTTSSDLPGYCFGWWPFSDYGLHEARRWSWPDAPDPEEWVFLAVCDSDLDLDLLYSDAGFLWATVPAAELAADDFCHLRCDGESS